MSDNNMEIKGISRREFCKKASLATAGMALGVSCNEKVTRDDPRTLQPPQNVQVQEDSSRVTITWSPVDDPQLELYRLYRNDLTAPFELADSTTLVDTTVTNDITYTYVLVCVDRSGKEGAAYSFAATPAYYEKSPVIAVTSAAATSTTEIKVMYDEVRDMVACGVKRLYKELNGTDPADTGAAFESLFPGLTAASIIGIKVNALVSLITHAEVAFAVAENLTTMLGGTFPASNILIFDDNRSGNFFKSESGYADPGTHSPVIQDVRIVASGFCSETYDNDFFIKYAAFFDAFPELKTDYAGYLAANSITVNGSTQRVDPVLLKSDYIINIPVLKDHSESGTTSALKNMYGCINNPSALHGGCCVPGIPALYSQAAVKNKVRLVVGDALYVGPDGGPGSASITASPNTLVIGTDPVATDVLAFDLVNTYRLAAGYQVVSRTEVVDKHKPAAFIDACADKATYALGNKYYRRIDIT